VVFSDTLNANLYLCLDDNEMCMLYSIGLLSTIQISNDTFFMLLTETPNAKICLFLVWNHDLIKT
jgi:hypothetical protein